MPSSSTYCHRFGGLDHAYQQVAWTRIGNLNNVESSRRFKASRRNIISAILQAIKSCGAELQSIDPYGLLSINNEFTASIKVAGCVHNRPGNGWKVSFDRTLPPDLTLIVRMAAGNESILDYYVLPSTDIPSKALYIGEHMTMAITVPDSTTSISSSASVGANPSKEQYEYAGDHHVPITEIFIASPRVRNRKKWIEIVGSISAVGLKRPITVSRRR